jgi:hypothetical protein
VLERGWQYLDSMEFADILSSKYKGTLTLRNVIRSHIYRYFLPYHVKNHCPEIGNASMARWSRRNWQTIRQKLNAAMTISERVVISHSIGPGIWKTASGPPNPACF